MRKWRGCTDWFDIMPHERDALIKHLSSDGAMGLRADLVETDGKSELFLWFRPQTGQSMYLRFDAPAIQWVEGKA